MSLKISDLGLEDTMRELVTDLASSRIYFAELVDTSPDPFTPNASYPAELFRADAFLAKVLNADQASREFGQTDRIFYKCSIATPLSPYVEALVPGIFAFIDFSDGVKIVSGRVKRVDRNLSSLIDVYVDASDTVPFSPLDLGLPF